MMKIVLALAALVALVAYANADVQCPDGSSSCPDGNTCCALADGSYGCCPYPSAVCCSDHQHCCPSGYTCDLQDSTCNKQLGGDNDLRSQVPMRSIAQQ